MTTVGLSAAQSVRSEPGGVSIAGDHQFACSPAMAHRQTGKSRKYDPVAVRGRA